MTQFIYFLTNPGNEAFLKHELQTKFNQNFMFSFSRTGLCTFKNTGKKLGPEEIKNLPIAFARSWGESVGMFEESQVIDYCTKLKKQFSSPSLFAQLYREQTEDELIFQKDLESISSKNASKIVVVLNTAPNKYFIGKQLIDKFNSPAGRYFYDINITDAPSRAYHKIKEAFLLLNLEKKSLKCAEFGCAPGGASKFLLENGHTVIGIDPAQMNDEILQYNNFTFINKPMQEVSKRDFPKDLDVLISDVNLNPNVVLKQCLGIFKKSSPPLALITLKTPKPKYLDSFSQWKSSLKAMGYTQIDFVQLSSHRKECLAIGRK